MMRIDFCLFRSNGLWMTGSLHHGSEKKIIIIGRSISHVDSSVNFIHHREARVWIANDRNGLFEIPLTLM